MTQRQEVAFLRILSDRACSSPSELQPAAAPRSRRGTLSCLRGGEPGLLLSASTPDSLSIIPASEVGSQLSSPAAGTSRNDPAGCHGRRGMMQAIKNERRASKVRGGRGSALSV